MNKIELRNFYLQKRKQLTLSERNEIDLKVFLHFKTLLVQLANHFEDIHVFLPIENKNEINTWTLLDFLFKEYPSLNVYTSVVEQKVLFHKKVTLQTNYTMDKWGIPNPNVIENVVFKNPLLVIVPLLICDRMGYRVGYGKGFYDRFLTDCPNGSMFIGLSSFEPIMNVYPDDWDVPMDIIISPSELYQIKKA
jgi:5-formyltetrahydrofolate cyclo-ligase